MSAKTFFGSFLQGFALEGFGEHLRIPGAPQRIFAEGKSRGLRIVRGHNFLWIDLDALMSNESGRPRPHEEVRTQVIQMVEDQLRLIQAKQG